MHAGDITRSSFDAARHYSGVRMQQGRVQLDADWNEQLDIEASRNACESIDTVGPFGAPKANGGFELVLSPGEDDLLISVGRMWVGGALCETGTAVTTAEVSGSTLTVGTVALDGVELRVHDWVELDDGTTQAVVRVTAIDVKLRQVDVAPDPTALGTTATLRRLSSYTVQPDLRRPEHVQAGNGTPPTVDLAAGGPWLAYLDVWQRAVTGLEDPAILERALGDADTATRLRTVWQVRLLELTGAGDVNCASDLSAWTTPAFAASTGTMAAQTDPAQIDPNLCTPTTAGGFNGLENQLYRVQVHSVDSNGAPSIVWSRDNGSVVTPWTATSAVGSRTALAVGGLGRDLELGFASGQWVELLDEDRELTTTPGTLVRLLAPQGDLLVLDGNADGSTDIADFSHFPAKVRRWDSEGAVPVTFDTWIPLEHGVQVRFAAGTYRRGDYWLVPARTALADVEWPQSSAGEPLARPPLGIAHSYAPLALVTTDSGQIEVTDCRVKFPSLTTITARDVSFDDSACLLHTTTVQETIDELCKRHDIARHQKLLHGWGIVCGLQVHCDTDDANHGSVRILRGTTIGCEGEDLDLEAPTSFDVMSEVNELANGDPTILDENGDGEVCLLLQPDAEQNVGFGVEKFDPEADQPPKVLEGTLVLDFYNDCIKSLHDWLKQELTVPAGEEGNAASPARQRVSALVNLTTEVANAKSGRNIFISAKEDALLRSFYTGLRERLQSETFCAMFRNARTPPDYPEMFDNLDIIFGAGGHQRLRLNPAGTEAWTVGAGLNPLKPAALINRYDLTRGMLIERIDPLAGTEVAGNQKTDPGTAAATDVAFSRRGRRIFVAVPTRNENDTIFRAGDMTRTGVRWSAPVTICDLKIVTLATTEADPDSVYFVALKKVTKTEDNKTHTTWHSAGLYRINPDAIDVSAGPLLGGNRGVFFTGHLVVGADGVAVATARLDDDPVGVYTTVVEFTLPLVDRLVFHDLGMSGSDDLAVLRSSRGRPDVAFAAVDVGSRAVGIVTVELGGRGQPVSEPLAVQERRGAVRLTDAAGLPAIISTEDYVLRVVDPTARQLREGFLVPLQVGPISATTDASSGKVYVLNYVSNTISTIDPRIFETDVGAPLKALATYRAEMIGAFADLLGGFLQYLKDCLFDHFLVRIPECTGEEKLYLACVTIRNKQVYKVCNFSRRRYVKSFPTIGYWLSIIPAFALLKPMFAKLACDLVADRFRDKGVGDPATTKDRASVQQIQQLLQWAQEADVFGKLDGFRSTTRAVGGSAVTRLVTASPPPRAPSPTPSPGILMGLPIDQAVAALESHGLTVEQTPLSAGGAPPQPGPLAGVLRQARPGGHVTLYEDDGRVRAYAVGGAPVATVADTAALHERVAALEQELASIRASTAPPSSAGGRRPTKSTRARKEPRG